MTNEGQKRENFSIAKLGEEAAESMAITQRRKWLKALPVTHLAYAHHAAEVAEGPPMSRGFTTLSGHNRAAYGSDEV
ncbi:hypothetical protein PX860_26320 (plasmid) [Agrobacterium leguminum]|uniref:hypothetical protein n=1 Tax=Agrobacterium leguminum TaxID=2792015 RepID=UPI00272B6C68|nr:hypothetical protein [Agrobacterium leguminum]WLE00417.1 hypothetical protein PX860_26320 [Agrobacterium leguminum]